MKGIWIAVAALAVAWIAPGAFANDNFPLQARSKAAIAAPHTEAPFLAPAGEPQRESMFTPS
ncbi:MAG: hypothetical protein ACM3X5_03070, partial [Bacillota bacterium]